MCSSDLIFFFGKISLLRVERLSIVEEVLTVAKCDICGKGVHFGNNVSHSHRRSNKIWKSNIKKVKCNINGAAKRIHVCTRCLRSGCVERA